MTINTPAALALIERLSAVGGGGGAGGGTIVNVYEVADSPATWTKDAGAKWIRVICIGGGAGGTRGISGFNENGGAGGAPGGLTDVYFEASAVSSPQTVTVGAGGAGEPASTESSVVVAAGGAGGDTTFGTLVRASGAPLTHQHASTAGVRSVVNGEILQSPGGMHTSNWNGASNGAATTRLLPTGGGTGAGSGASTVGGTGGAWTNSGPVLNNGGSDLAGGVGGDSVSSGVALAGADGATLMGYIGMGGGGGGAARSGASGSGAGGNGGLYGGGGGGAGGKVGGSGGKGGDGGPGVCIVIQYL